eukprot:jgi/Botrbrau1/16612/Bobra.0068s0039.1
MDGKTLPVLSSVTKFEKIARIGEGTYGVVYQARNRQTGEVVALKKVRMDRERDGMPVTSVREMRVLQNCRHPNLVALCEVVTGSKPDSIFLVFEFCEHDLGRLLDSLPNPFTISEVKCLLKQLLEGVAFLHSRWVMHRDIKLSNLLLTRGGHLKLCDFGLARYFRPFQQAYTPRVITLWYRAPEVLLGEDEYTEAVDMWSVGAVFGELLKHEPLFPGKTELDMLSLMASLLGAPSEAIWPGFSKLPGGSSLRLPAQPYNYLAKVFPKVSEAGIDLLNRMLTYDPERRITARSALKHPFFQEIPLAKAPEDMPTFPAHQSAPAASKRGALRAEADAEDRGLKRVRGGNGLDDRFGEAFGDSVRPVGMRQAYRRA